MAESVGKRRDRAHVGLIAVCAAFAVVSLAAVSPATPLGWDELVYASRFGPYGPETPFSAPRTRGVPALIAPVAALSDSTVLLRCYLTATATAALYLGFRPWLRTADRRAAVPLAAGLYAGVWFALFYAGSAMPNHYVAMGLAAATGCFLTAVTARRARARTYAALAAALACAALMRPNDAVWPASLLLVALAAVPAWRRQGRRAAALAAAITGGLAAGLLPWAIEAWVRFGGVRERLHAASEVQGGMRPGLALRAHAAALDGPLLCRPCGDASVGWASAGWWLLIPPLTVCGVLAARAARRRTGGAGRTACALLPVGAACAVAAPYLFFMDYAAPRFLLPAYALLAPVVAGGVIAPARWALRRPGTWWLVPLGGAVAVAHLAIQLHQLGLHAHIQAEARKDWQRIAGVLRDQGIRDPCVLAGNSSAIPVAHTVGCRTGSARTATALILREAPLPPWADPGEWRTLPVPGTYNPGWRIAVRR